MKARATTAAGQPPLWPMAAVARRTGIGPHTLRAWERRFGFPQPLRLPSGHRRFTEEQVARLRLIAQAIGLGHRAGDVVPLPHERLRDLLGASLPETDSAAAWAAGILDRARAFDREGIARDFARASASMGVRAFLHERLLSLTAAVGGAWAAGRLDIKHEHFLSEIVEDTLRTLRAPLEHGAQGQPVLLATLPAERHTIGLQAAALVTAIAGRRVRILGAQTPVGEIASAAARLDPLAVGVSVTRHTALPATARQVNRLRATLADAVALWIGGAGAPLLAGLRPGITLLATLSDLEDELRRAAGGDSHPARF
ncbi:MAG TPA: MerR family transcriptional regulator [Thermoanaerobaculaceae bacterium]|nr:MerR family transcriptional regulator [Thermoanaerobaculaceae bacterium]